MAGASTDFVQVLHEVACVLEEERDLAVAMRQVANQARELLGADHVSLYLVEAGELICWGRSGLATELFGPAHGSAALTAKICEAHTVRIDDVAGDRRIGSDFAEQLHARSLLAAPLRATGAVLGVLAATHGQPGAFSQEDVWLAELVAMLALPRVLQAQSSPAPDVAPRLEHALASPLRLRVVSELLEVGARGLSLEDAVVRTGRHRQDVLACLQPLVAWKLVTVSESQDRRSYLLEPAAAARLRPLVQSQAVELNTDRRVRDQLFGGLIGADPKMLMVFEAVRHLARVDVPVLISGERGTGKALAARAIHDRSPRRDGFFGVLDCTSLPAELFASQLCGYVEGAQPGASQDYVGLLERCQGGTLFLDGVDALPPDSQHQLVRLVAERTYRRLGDEEPRDADVRFIGSTTAELPELVAAGRLTEALYHGLTGFPLRMPSLRERLDDLPYLVEGALSLHGQRFRGGTEQITITPEALEQLRQHRWPGNVQELESVVVRAAMMAGVESIGPQHLPEVELLSERPGDDGEPPSERGGAGASAVRSLEEAERDHIMEVLRSQRGNISASAQVLKISRTTLYRKIREYGIDAPV